MKTSDHLTPGAVHTRKDLMEKFGISDATINTGIFQPAAPLSPSGSSLLLAGRTGT